MRYGDIVAAEFMERPNRFIAYVNLYGERTKVHVKNTGRCRELLKDHAKVYLEKNSSESRATAYDLVAVDKDGRLVNMDSNAPNQVAGEWLRAGGLYGDVSLVKPETIFGNSRFDFYVESASGEKAFVEVKGVTLERNGTAAFPDAPSERALKHVEELIEARKQGYAAYLLFVIQMKGVNWVEPNWETQPAFGEALKRARRAGVRLLAYDCLVREDGLEMDAPVPVVLDCLDRIAAPLLTWYDNGRRILPWREDPTPYHVWISEIMLQQTRVEAVKPYFERFVKELPDVKALAECGEEQLLKLWEGLGYYNRVRNMQTAAKQIMQEYHGELPDDYEELLKLKGIGRYTAGAIASIAYGRPVPAVDGNVLRVLSRAAGDGRDIMAQSVKSNMEQQLQAVIPQEKAGMYNQALMELGATVCLPNGEPQCDKCPWQDMCIARKEERIAELPVKKKPKKRRIEERTVFLIRDGEKIVLKKRPSKGLLAGMYEFPNESGYMDRKEVVSYVDKMNLTPLYVERLPDAKHIFSHVEWHMAGYLIRVEELEEQSSKILFAETADFQKNYPMPSAFAAYMEYLNIRFGKERFSKE